MTAMHEYSWRTQGGRYASNRLERVVGDPTGSARIVITPIDDSLITGPYGGLDNLSETIAQISAGRPTAVLGFTGQFERYGHLIRPSSIGWICNLTASLIGEHHTRKQWVTSVRHAIRIGCDAVAAHVNITSPHEPQMIENLGRIAESAYVEGIPTVGIIYPRGRAKNGEDDNYESLMNTDPSAYSDLIARCVRIGSDLGVSMVKTQYTNDPAVFSKICDSNPGVAVVVAGGALQAEPVILARVREIHGTSAAGISFGRNIYHRNNIANFLHLARVTLEEG
jgi:fructose-bisphosphate aldolase / 2-amino-3,7-dideoxy-D-threo-hept-6-ulosonate synthase